MNEEKQKKVNDVRQRLAELHAEGRLNWTFNQDSAHFRVSANRHAWDVWPAADRWRREPYKRSVTCLDMFWADLESRSRKSPDAQSAERWTPGLLRLEALEQRMGEIEDFLWAESGYAPNGVTVTGYCVDAVGRIVGVDPKPETVEPAPRATGRAGEGVRELSREEQVAILYPDGHDARGTIREAYEIRTDEATGQGRAAIQSREVAHAAAVRLHDYCDRHGYEGIGHSIGLLVAELERQS